MRDVVGGDDLAGAPPEGGGAARRAVSAEGGGEGDVTGRGRGDDPGAATGDESGAGTGIPAPPEDVVGRAPGAGPAAPSDAPRRGDEPRGNARAARGGVHEPRTVAEFETAIAVAWDAARAGAPRPDAADLEFAAQQARDRTAADHVSASRAAAARVAEQVRILSDRADLHAKRGVTSGGPLVLEIRARGRESVEGDEPPGPLAAGDFDPYFAGGRNDEGVGVVGAIPRRGFVFVVERVEIDARLGRARSDRGEIEVRLPRFSSPRWEGGTERLRAVYEGCDAVADVNSLRLYVNDSVARVRFSGRVVPAREAPEPRPFVWVATESLGFLRGEAPVRLQIAADHGGGNPRTIDVTGVGSYRFDSAPGRPVWDDALDLAKFRGSSYWSESAGIIPPGHVFRVTRIDWRARLLGGEKHSRFDIRMSGEKLPLVEVEPPRDAPKGQAVVLADTWTGDLRILPGRERDLTFTCHMYGMADITVHGRLEPAGR